MTFNIKTTGVHHVALQLDRHGTVKTFYIRDSRFSTSNGNAIRLCLVGGTARRARSPMLETPGPEPSVRVGLDHIAHGRGQKPERGWRRH